MGVSGRGSRLLAMASALGIALGGARLTAQDPKPGGEMPSASTAKAKKGTATKAKKGDANPVDGFGPVTGDDAPTKVKGKKGAAKGSSKKADAKKAEPPAVAEDASAVTFSKDIAPILVGNCTGCHNAERKRGKFDMTSFQKLMTGSASQKVITPGNPAESPLILKVRGEQAAGGKMPPGQRNLAPETIAKLEAWIKAGAILDKGIDPAAALDAIAASPEARRRAELARMSPEERDKKLSEVGSERWKKASANASPIVTKGKNFLVFSNLPPARADRLLKAMDGQRKTLGDILGPKAGALTGPEKISLYVFKDNAGYVEFVRSVESREVENGIEGHGRLDVEQPYVAAIDPLNNAEEAAPSATKKSSKSRKGQADEAPDGPDRTLAGILSENLASSALNAAGKPPRWLNYGLGAFLASRVDPKGSYYYRKLREEASGQYALGWGTKANEVLGDEGSPETIRGVGYSLCDWMATVYPPLFPAFVQGMTQGREKLDEVIRGCFGDDVTREIFLNQWGEFVGSRYRRR